MSYDFLVRTCATERLKVLSVWAMFRDEDLAARPRAGDPRGRTPREHMVHQCASEDLWFRKMLGIDVGAPPLPEEETRSGFLRRYAEDSRKRVEALAEREPAWWEAEVPFFEVTRTRAWIVVRRIAHTAHHRGQQTALLRMLGREVWSTYGPTADTGGLPTEDAPTLYPYPDEETLLAGEASAVAPGAGAAVPGARRVALPGPAPGPVTERPDR